MHAYSKVILPILLLHVATSLIGAAPMGTAFNYQGYLTYKGNPANGPHDITFELYNVPSGGVSLATVTHAPAHLNKGLLTTNIDFASFAFDGNAYWLQIGVRPFGSSNPYEVQTPRLQIRPVPYALFASNAAIADTAATANGVSANAVGGAGLQNNSITENKLAFQVVKSLNGLFDHVTLAAGQNVTITTNPGNALTINASGGGSTWSLFGNANTTAGLNFLGTTDDEPLQLRANGIRAMQLSYVDRISGAGGPFSGRIWGINVLGGLDVNMIGNGVVGATIAGGGSGTGSLLNPQYNANEVGGDFGTIGGGAGNIVGAAYATISGGADNQIWSAHGTIPGGKDNWVSGIGGFAAGQDARVHHDGSFVWGDGTQIVMSQGPRRFDVLATGGAGIFTYGASPAATLHVQDFGGGVGVFVGDLSPFGNAAFESNLSSSRTHLYFAESGNRVFSVGAGGVGYFEGNVSVCSLTIRGGCDLAEPFQMSEEEIPKGSVVVIDDENPGRLKRSTQPYDTRVAGIVSGANGVRTGIALKQEGTLDQGENVALSGRVYVKADANFGAIKPGDLLTTSATPGHAMKASDPARAQGAILGKAMSALSDGTGMVLVLVTLQ